MIHDVDETLRQLIRRDVLNGSNVDVAFDAPSRDWASRRKGPTLNLYLYDIIEFRGDPRRAGPGCGAADAPAPLSPVLPRDGVDPAPRG
jgi:hypothetical protein